LPSIPAFGPGLRQHPPAATRGVIEGIQRGLSENGIDPSDVALLSHAATVVTNALLEHKGARHRLIAIGKLPGLKLAQPCDLASARVRTREVWFAASGSVPVDVYWRNGLAPGTSVMGPAIIEALDSTTVLPPGRAGQIGELGYIRLPRGNNPHH
jgi:N-methylhydantoinase A/oxoprolinase/acetone carboxylase beta subunit